jgi:hypothetical protein
MPDRETSTDKTGSSTSQRPNDRAVPQDPDVGQQNDPDSQKSGASRPRGQTEEPDRTL